jgi:predicted Zn-dependent protease
VPALLRATAILETHGAAQAGEELLDRLIEEEPRHAPDILTARARIYTDTGDLPRALAVLDNAVAEYPDSVDLRYAKASFYEEAGRVGDALRELKALVKARPDDPTALNALGYTLADHSLDLARARKLIEVAHAAAPKNAAIMDSLGWVLFRQGHSALAETYLRTAYLDDRGGDIAAHLGEVLWQLGRTQDAERIWDEGSAADSGNRLLKETRGRFHPASPESPAPPLSPAAPALPAAPAAPATDRPAPTLD